MRSVFSVLPDRKFQQVKIVSLALILILTGCVVARIPREKGWPMETEEGMIATEEAFLEHQLFENIDLGMTREEVLKSCGKPRNISKTDGGEV